MIIKKNKIDHHPLKLGSNSFIMDIETTGFSAKYATIYLIGLVYPTDEGYTSEQWFCEKPSDEYELLFKFNQLLEETPTLYHYNGDGFDMPFIKKRMALFGMVCNAYESVDLLKVARPFKRALGLDNLKLKTIEAYFGYEREDIYSGRDLIDVYKNYLTQEDEGLMDTLLLHNYEDLIGLMDTMKHMNFFTLLRDFKARHVTVTLSSSAIEDGKYKATFPINVPINKSLHNEGFDLSFEDGMAFLSLDVELGELYYFFPDYKNYVYLINEDYAIHKSVGKFVAKDHRKSATKETAYVKKEGIFLQSFKHYELPVPLYYKDKKQKKGYVSIEDLIETDNFETYIQARLSDL